MQSTLHALESVIENWPSSQKFSAEAMLAAFPTVCDQSAAQVCVLIEEYMRALEDDPSLVPRDFLATAKPWATRHLQILERAAALLDVATDSFRHGPSGSDAGSFPAVGDRLGTLRIIRELGRGTFSRVYLAADEMLEGRRVAAKVTPHESSERCVLSQMSHPHLPRVLSTFVDQSTSMHVLVFEFIGSHTLSCHIERPQNHTSTTSPHCDSAEDTRRFAIRTINEVGSALAHLHEHGILHLDVKPSNVLIDHNGHAVLIDLNLSAHRLAAASLGFRGTPPYAAPELLDALQHGGYCSVPPSLTADIYSLGALCCELLCGTLPWRTEPRDSRQTKCNILDDRRNIGPSINALLSTESASLRLTLVRALEFDPFKRFPTVSAFLQSLNADYRILTKWLGPPTTTQAALGLFAATVASTALLVTPAIRQSNMPAQTAPPADLPIARNPPYVPGRNFNDRPHDPAKHDSVAKPTLSSVKASAIVNSAANALLANDPRRSNTLLSSVAELLNDDPGFLTLYGYTEIKCKRIGRAGHLADIGLRIAPGDAGLLTIKAISEVERAKFEERAVDWQYFDRLIESVEREHPILGVLASYNLTSVHKASLPQDEVTLPFRARALELREMGRQVPGILLENSVNPRTVERSAILSMIDRAHVKHLVQEGGERISQLKQGDQR